MKQLQIVKQEPTKPTTRTMTKVRCFCGEMKNTFLIDSCNCSDGWINIRLCKDCAKKEGFKIDLEKTKKCQKCGERFESCLDWQIVCPVCYIKSREGIQ